MAILREGHELSTAIQKYSNLVEGGHVKAKVKNNKVVFLFNRYDQETGAITEKIKVEYDITEVESMIARAKAELAKLEAIEKIIKDSKKE